MARSADLRVDYDRLGELLKIEDDGAKAAALARERRMIGEVLEAIETPKGASVVDELANRRSGPEDAGSPAGRRRSRGG